MQVVTSEGEERKKNPKSCPQLPSNNAERLALPAIAHLDRILPVLSPVHPSSRVTRPWKDRRVPLAHNLELAVRLARRLARHIRTLLLLPLEQLLEGLSAVGVRTGGGFVHTVANADELSVNVFHAGGDSVFDSLLDLTFDETGRKGFESFVEGVVFRVADGELEGVQLHVDILDLEDGAVCEERTLASVKKKGKTISEGERGRRI